MRAALLTLVDPITGQKTVDRPTEELLSGIDPTAPEKARLVLDLLAQEEVIRRRVDPGTGEGSWLLDHDYLARAVREADRRANRWQRALAEGAKALADAGAAGPVGGARCCRPRPSSSSSGTGCGAASAMAGTARTPQKVCSVSLPLWRSSFWSPRRVATSGKDGPKRGLRSPLTTF